MRQISNPVLENISDRSLVPITPVAQKVREEVEQQIIEGSNLEKETLLPITKLSQSATIKKSPAKRELRPTPTLTKSEDRIADEQIKPEVSSVISVSLNNEVNHKPVLIERQYEVESVSVPPTELSEYLDESEDLLDLVPSEAVSEVGGDELFRESIVNEIIAEEEVYTFSESVVDTYEQLVVLIEEDMDQQPSEDLTEDFSDRDDLLEPAELRSFESYIAQQIPEESISIAEVVESADERPLSETLIQLYYALSEADIQTDELAQDIESVLEDIIILQDEVDKSGTEPVSIELTEKLLTLVEMLGYDDPQTALIELVEEHSLDFLLQAVVILHQQYDLKEYREILPPLTSSSTGPLNSQISYMLGQAMLKLVFFGYTPELIS